MFWIVIGVIGCTIFVAINAFVFNPPESLLKLVLKRKSTTEKKDDDKCNHEKK